MSIGIKTLLCSKDPESHPFITDKEKDYLRSEIGQLQRDDDLPPIPWKHIIFSVPVCALLISQVKTHYLCLVELFNLTLWLQMGSECTHVLLGMGLPKYMKEILGFPVRDIGFYFSTLSLLSWIVSIIAGFLCDFLIGRKHLTIVQARKLFTTLCECFKLNSHWFLLLILFVLKMCYFRLKLHCFQRSFSWLLHLQSAIA